MNALFMNFIRAFFHRVLARHYLVTTAVAFAVTALAVSAQRVQVFR